MAEAEPSGEDRAKAFRMLASPYFLPVCRSILDPYLGGSGFRLTRSGYDRLTDRRGACVMDFSYVPYATDRRPRYAITAAIGARRGLLRKPRLIGLWQVPSPDRGGKRWQWEFRGAEGLRRSLKRLVRLLDAYAKPLWEDEIRLQEVLDKEWPIYLELQNR